MTDPLPLSVSLSCFRLPVHLSSGSHEVTHYETDDGINVAHRKIDRHVQKEIVDGEVITDEQNGEQFVYVRPLIGALIGALIRQAPADSLRSIGVGLIRFQSSHGQALSVSQCLVCSSVFDLI